MTKELVLTDEALQAISSMTPSEEMEFRRLAYILHEDGFLRAPYAEKISGEDNLFVLRIRKGGNFREFYCYATSDEIWFLNGYEKKSSRIPQRELHRAKQLKRKYAL